MVFRISIVVPNHNGERTLRACLEAIFSQSVKPFEVIVVDDCSSDRSVAIAKGFSCKVKKLEKNSGPAVARNIGAKITKGDIITFVDADAILHRDSLEKMIADYKQYPDVACVCGTFSKFSGGSGWIDKFRNLQVYWWHNQDRLDKKFITIFMVTGGSIRRQVFFEMEGFNTEYADADVEDFELGHRIVKKYKILLDKSIQFDHDHYRSPFWVLAKKLFKRSKMWVPLSLKRKGFEANYATPNRGLGVMFAGLSLFALLLTPFFPLSAIAFVVLLALFVLTDPGFYLFLFREGGLFFLLYSVCVYYFFTLAMAFGVGFGLLSYLAGKK